MKKRLLSCLALLLLAATLLCSCAEGLPLSELYFAAKDAANGYTEKLCLLQEGSKTIAADGESEYIIEYDSSRLAEATVRQNELKDAINALAARVKAQTGADLLDKKREGATKRIVISFAQGDDTDKVSSAAQFYIGFSGDDLIIQATNEIMLISALNYFADTYLGEKNELILSPDLSYLSPTTTYRSREHNLIRAEQTGAVATQAATALCDTLFEIAGVRFSVKSDFNTTGGLTDILFGYPDTEEAQAILSTLSFDDFYIGVRGGKLMILAKNDPALEKATQYFISAFVTAKDAVFDKTEKTVTLPAVCDYYHRSDAILLADDGVNNAVLVYASNLSSTVKNVINTFASLYKRLTNTELPVYADNAYAYTPGTFEILVGGTNRTLPQQTYLETLPTGRWMISVIPEMSTLALYAKDELSLTVAIKQLENDLTAQTRAISKRPEDAEGWLSGDTNRTLYISAEHYLTGVEPPDLPGEPFHYYYNNFYRIRSTKQVSERSWNSYQWRIQAAGFTRLSYSEKSGVITCVYQCGTRVVTLTYNKNDLSMELRATQARETEE